MINLSEDNPRKSAEVSVIIPYYNSSPTIKKAIESVIYQTTGVKELIIVDDCSEDSKCLQEIIGIYKDNIPIKSLRLNNNSGASEARNCGVNIATGKYLAFLDSDDTWHPRKIEIQYSIMERDNIFFSGHLYIHDLNHKSIQLDSLFESKHIGLTHFIFGNPFFTPTIMVRRVGFIKFDSRYRRVDDYKCWLMNIKKRRGVMILTPLAGGWKAAIGSSGLTSSFRIMHESFVTVLNDLHKEGHVSSAFFFGARLVEIFKYPIRIIKSRAAARLQSFRSLIL